MAEYFRYDTTVILCIVSPVHNSKIFQVEIIYRLISSVQFEFLW